MVELLLLHLTSVPQFLLSQLLSPTSRRNTIGNARTYVHNNEARVHNHCCHRKLYYTFWVCICSCSYPACNAQVPHLRLWLVWPYRIFPYFLIKGKIVGKKLLDIKYVFLSMLQLLSRTFLILRRTDWSMITNVHRSSCKVPVILVRF